MRKIYVLKGNLCLLIYAALPTTLSVNYAYPSLGDAYSDRQLSPNFELWVEIFGVQTCFHVRIPKPCLSVRTPRKDITLASSKSVLH